MTEAYNPMDHGSWAQDVVPPNNPNGHAIQDAAMAAQPSPGPSALLDGTDTDGSRRAHECPHANQPLSGISGPEYRAKPAIGAEQWRANIQVQLEELQTELEISRATGAILANSSAEKDEALKRSNLHVAALQSKLQSAAQLAAETIRVCEGNYRAVGLNAPAGMPTTHTSQEPVRLPGGCGVILDYSRSSQRAVSVGFPDANNIAHTPSEVDGHPDDRRIPQSPPGKYQSLLPQPRGESCNFAAGPSYAGGTRGTRDARSLSPDAHEERGDNGSQRLLALRRARAHIADHHRVTIQRARWERLNTELNDTKAKLAAASLERTEARAQIVRLEQKQESDSRNWRGLNNKAKRAAQEGLEKDFDVQYLEKQLRQATAEIEHLKQALSGDAGPRPPEG